MYVAWPQPSLSKLLHAYTLTAGVGWHGIGQANPLIWNAGLPIAP